MLMKRVIPCLDVHEGRVVKGVNFVNLRDAGDPVEMAAIYDREGADEVVFLDITASHEERPTMLEVAARTSEECFIPYTVGGGMRSATDIRAMLAAGADKISLNSAAVRSPELITETSRIYGSQCIVVAIDARRVAGDRDRWEVFINGGRINTELDAVGWAEEAERLGAGEILLTSMDCDGTEAGYDIELTRAIARSVIKRNAASRPMVELYTITNLERWTSSYELKYWRGSTKMMLGSAQTSFWRTQSATLSRLSLPWRASSGWARMTNSVSGCAWARSTTWSSQANMWGNTTFECG